MYIKKQALVFITLFLITSSCYSQSSKGTEGLWKARGYGWVAEINSKTIRLYDTTKISCFLSVEYPVSIFSEGIAVSNDVLTLKRGVTQYVFDRIEKLPELCRKKLSKKEKNNPILNFEVLWNTFHEQYAYFLERSIDWKGLYDIYRSKISENTTDVELFAVCRTMLKVLKDGHVSIKASDKIMKKAAKLNNEAIRSKADISGVRRAIITKYLENPKTHNISRTIWGKINDSIGYIQLNSMGAQGDYGITATTPIKEAQKRYRKYLSGSPDVYGDDNKGMQRTMTKALNDLGDTKKIIMDLRFNGGGEDMVGLIALSHFITDQKPVFHKKNRVNNSFSDTYTFQLSPAEKTYKGKLYILQSHWSASATEVLLLSTMSFDYVERIGSTSEGIFSDVLDKKLPNGWVFGLSNQVYLDNQGISYEAKGIPVHVDLEYPKNTYDLVDKLKKDLKTKGDTAIEYVLGKI